MTIEDIDTQRAAFHSMEEGTALDWSIIAHHNLTFAAGLPDRMLAHLRMLEGDAGGFAVDRLEHSLQTATRAYRADRDDEYVVCALLHDIGDILGPYNHADIAASVLKPFVSDANHWMVEQARRLPGLLLLPPPRSRPQRPRRVRRPRVLRPLRRVLPRLRPGGLRPGVRHAPARALRAGGARGAERPPPQHLHARRRRGHDCGRLSARSVPRFSLRPAAAWRPSAGSPSR